MESDWPSLVAASLRPDPVVAEDYIGPIAPTSYAAPHQYAASDGLEYAVKLPRKAELRALISDHVVALAGRAIGAPVPWTTTMLVEEAMLPPGEPAASAGVAHALEFVRQATNGAIAHVESNRERFGSLMVLYTWTGTPRNSDYQLIYGWAGETPVVYSVDHGAFLQPSCGWTATSLGAPGYSPDPTGPDEWCARSLVSDTDCLDAVERLRALCPEDVASIAAAVPDTWGITREERVAICRFLWARRRATLRILGAENG